MTVQATGIFYLKPSYFYLVQDMDDKNDNQSKEDKKEGKEFLLHSLPFQIKLINKANFNLTPAIIIAPPVIDHLTPPPDWAV